MKRAVFGALLGAGLAVAAIGALGQRSEVLAQRLTPPQAIGAGDLIAVPTPLGDKGQLLTVIDPRQQVMSVYHIELASGRIALRSVRNLRCDLQVTYLNNDTPLPQEIRSLLEQK